MKKFIPIIGTISSGKSTFLKSLLGINSLETGVSTTTKFVCIIQNSESTKFYHVIPKNQGILKFEKDGMEVIGEENVAKKIEEINKELSNKTISKNNFFYMLEIPIKYINNKKILDNYLFLDIPGLNEYKNNYINIISSYIKIDDIFFEIIIFDSTSISSDNIFNIIKELERKKFLKRKNNLFILNKIDKVDNKDDIIENFRNIFYMNFEDEKNKKDEDSIFINIYDNHFFPMNSLLYLAETRINEDFSYLLQFEYFNFSEKHKNGEDFSFFDYIKTKIDTIINPRDIKKPKITLDLNLLDKKEMNIFETSIENFKKMFGIHKIKKSIIQNELKSLYFLYKRKYYIVNHSEYYNNLQNILNNIDNKKTENINSFTYIRKEIKAFNYDKNEKKLNLDLFIKLEKSLINYLKTINQNKTFSSLNDPLKDLLNNLSKNKLRISFIGNINVGKSTVLNSIIGRNILPTDNFECTYRGVFIRHSEDNEYKLFKMKMVKDIKFKDQFYFQEEKEPYCKGVLNIRNFLKNKNNDRNIEDEDAFYIVSGRLKIFDYIKIHKYFMDKIEFIDLPGTDNKNNKFIKANYFDQIVNISNCCVYVNQPKTVEDKNSIDNIFYRRPKCYDNSFYMKYCLFLINKSDYLDSEEDKEKIRSLIYKQISLKEENIKVDDIQISFFSGKNFNRFLKVYNTYVYDMENEPLKALKEFYLDFNRNLYNSFGVKSLKQFILNEIEFIEEEFELDINDKKKVKVNPDFKKKINDAFSKLEYKIFMKDQEAIIEQLFYINQALKTKDFSGTIYSNEFFQKLKNVIINSEIFMIKNINKNLEECFEQIKSLKKNNNIANSFQTLYINEIITILEKILR